MEIANIAPTTRTDGPSRRTTYRRKSVHMRGRHRGHKSYIQATKDDHVSDKRLWQTNVSEKLNMTELVRKKGGVRWPKTTRLPEETQSEILSKCTESQVYESHFSYNSHRQQRPDEQLTMMTGETPMHPTTPPGSPLQTFFMLSPSQMLSLSRFPLAVDLKTSQKNNSYWKTI